MTDGFAPSPPAAGVDRRLVLGAVGLAAVGAACAPSAPPIPPPTSTPPTAPPPTVPPTTVPVVPVDPRVALLIDKVTFGPTPGLAERISTLGPQAWLEAQLVPTAGVPDAESRVAGYRTLTNSHRANYDVLVGDDGERQLVSELDYATIQRAVFSERQLYELMCDFWSNHFNTWRRKSWMGFLKSRSNETVIRPHALGKFSDMLLASAHDTAMLSYLDNINSSAAVPGGVNENYARELLELHTLGIIGGQHVYTEADVAGVAKILSGWSINWDDTPDRYNFRFTPWAHDRSAVQVLDGAFARPARSYGQGYADGVALLGVLAHHPSTARYVAFKLCRRFVGDRPPEQLVASTAAVFSANDTAIAPTLRHIFASAEFAASTKSRVRRPLEHLIACLRGLGATLPVDPLTQSTQRLLAAADQMGQPLHERPSPDGYPDVDRYWLSSEGLLQRWSVAARLARNRLTDPAKASPVVVDLAKVVPAGAPDSAAGLVAAMASRSFGVTLTAAEASGACSAVSVAPTAPAASLRTNATKLAAVVGLLLSHPDFQKR